jgi:4,5-DOPA dioxygenase extradiol
MHRKTFLKYMALSPLLGSALSLSSLSQWSGTRPASPRMPLLFLGHGSPMNAIEANAFSKGWEEAATNLPRPEAILCVSAHWETRGTRVTAMEQPRTIHDFGGFPQALFDVQYPAPGHPGLAGETRSLFDPGQVQADLEWGLDHGSWSVIRRMYPQADIPVLQLSLDTRLSPEQHFNLAARLAPLRRKGVLILGSGNIVHHLGRIDWKNPQGGYDWALEARDGFKRFIEGRDHHSLFRYQQLSQAYRLAVPTPEHYLPLLYILALQEKDEDIRFFNDQVVMGSIAMTSLRIH